MATDQERKIKEQWTRAHRVFVYVSDAASGVNCEGSSADPESRGLLPVASSSAAGCAYAAGSQGSSTPASANEAGSCPVIMSDSGEKLHPLTHMPLSLYTDAAGQVNGGDPGSTSQLQQPDSSPSTAFQNPQLISTAGSADSLSTSGDSGQSKRRRWWWGGKQQPQNDSVVPSGTDTTQHDPATAAVQSSRQAQQQGRALPAVTDPGTPQQSMDSSLGGRRQLSTIPMAAPADSSQLPKHQQDTAEVAVKEGGDKFWMYPSEQMFYNAMKRKGWDPNPHDMRTVVAIHNTVNEKAWQEVCEWEAMHQDECPCGPKLAKFQGRPQDLSPRARFLNLLGYAPPFDRHDWVVDRCGRKVRYIIDFYAGIPKPGGPPAAMWLDTRPALDSFEAVWDRVRVTGRWLYINLLYRE